MKTINGGTVTQVEENGGRIISEIDNFLLSQNYPNPFNPVTTLLYQLPEAGNVKITVFDILGREIALLVEETKTAGGIVLPGAAAEKPSRGEVVAVGPGKALENGEVRAMGVKVGDKVIFGQYAGSTVKIDGQELLIMAETEIFGVLEG